MSRVWLRTIARNFLRTSRVGAILATIVFTVSLMGSTSAADEVGTCPSCQATGSSLAVDASSYKLWPSGARTVLRVSWQPNDSSATFDVRNIGAHTVVDAVIAVEVDNHDPLSQTVQSTSTRRYPIPSLAPNESTSIMVPLDYSQCDIFLTIDAGSGSTTVLRTGNPAAC